MHNPFLETLVFLVCLMIVQIYGRFFLETKWHRYLWRLTNGVAVTAALIDLVDSIIRIVKLF